MLWFGARLVVEGKLSPGELSTFVIYAVYVGSNVGALAGIVSSLVQVSLLSCNNLLLSCADWGCQSALARLVSSSVKASQQPGDIDYQRGMSLLHLQGFDCSKTHLLSCVDGSC